MDQRIFQAREAVEKADAVFITAGAGIGVDSGLPDFRGDEGFWKAYPPIGKLGISFSEMANPAWFMQKPELAWAFYGHRLNLYRKTIPHDGFSKLLELGEQKVGGYYVFTSNVDGQFQRAGYNKKRIEECHGSIHHLQCTKRCNHKIWDAKETQVKVDDTLFIAEDPLPVCPDCGGLARPNILMFGDWHWLEDRSVQQAIRLDQWLHYLQENDFNLVIIELGAGKAVPTVRMKSERVAQLLGAKIIRINPRDYQVSQGHFSIQAGALEGVNLLLD